MNDRFKFRAVLKNKTDDLSIPFLENNVFDVISIGFKSDGIQTVTLLGHHKNGDYSIYEADAEDVELIQCTGLKDKNGNLIYEGDIIQIPNDYNMYGQFAGEKREVFYNEGGFRLKPKWDKNSRGNWLEDTKDFEVIGNIYENPDLLQECK